MMKEVREIWVSDEPQEAIGKIRRTLAGLGELTLVEPGVALNGVVAFGVQSATLRVTWRAEDADGGEKVPGRYKEGGTGVTTRPTVKLPGTILTVEADTEFSAAAASSAVERFEEAYLHYGNPDYRPDRLGVLPLTIIGVFIVIALLGVFLWRIPAVRRHLPNVPAPKSIEVPSPSPAPSVEGSGDADNSHTN